LTQLAGLRSRVAELELSESTQRPIHEALRESEIRYRRLFESARDGILILDAETGVITGVNPFLTDLLGYSEQEVLGKKLWEIGLFKDQEDSAIAFQELQTNEYIRYEDLPLETKDGRPIAVEFVSNVYVADDKKVIQCNIRDITGRRRTEEALRTSVEDFRSLAEAMPQIVWVTRPDGWNLYFNQQWMDYTGLTLEESVGHGWNTPFHPDDQQGAWDAWQHATNTIGVYSIESRLRRADGVYRWWLVRGVPLTDASGTILKWFGTCTDIHDLKVAALEISRINRALKMLSSCNEALIRTEREATLLTDVCRIAVENGGYRMAWIGYAAADVARSVTPMAHAGVEDGYFSEITVSWDENAPEGRGPAGRVIRTGQAAVSNDIAEDGAFAQALPFAQQRGYRANICLPLRDATHTFGVLGLFSADVHQTSAEELRLLQEMADNLAFGIGAVRARDERQRAQVASADAEERYRALFEKMLDGYAYCQMLFDGDRPQDFVYLAVNPAFERLTGLQQVVGRRVTEVIPGIKETDPQLFEMYGRVARSGQPERFEYQLKSLDVWLDISVYGAQDGRFVAVFDNITERKRAEETRRLQSAALHAAADAIVITDRDGAIEWVNPAFTQISGYRSDEALGQHHRDLVRSGKQAKAFFTDLWDTILAGRTWRGNIINRRKDGRLYTEDQSVTPIMDGSGAITHFVAIQQDITERLQLEAQFRQAQKMESVGQLASGIAHDFNNLLTVINGMMELVLAHVGQDDPLREDLQEIQHAGERAATLTRQLLAFSRQQILEPRVLNVATVVTGLESLLRRLLGEDIDLVVVPASEVRSVMADPGQIEQVITNLVVNARDAMPQGGRLTIEVQNVAIDEASAHQRGDTMPAGRYVRLAVGDSGVGMDEVTRARIFEPFFTTKGPGKGTGLGLSTVFGIVQQSQGFIRVESEVGQGTSFQIYLPQVTDTATGTHRAAPGETSTTGTETILLVDDEAGIRRLTTRFLERAGYTVIGAASGEDALQVLESQGAPVHLLLSDVVMPGMNGRQLAERLAQTHPRMKVLYMSGYTSDSIGQRGVLEAETALLNKPFTQAVLLRKVRDVLDSPA
jgi:PAS domain S-box-containing protein